MVHGLWRETVEPLKRWVIMPYWDLGMIEIGEPTMKMEAQLKYSPGLEGVIAGESSICAVDPNAGLLYRGYDIQELAAHANFEEVVWLLLHGELPTTMDLGSFSQQLAAERALPRQV